MSRGRVAMATIPCDRMAIDPRPAGGTSGTNRANTMYYMYKRNKGSLDGCGLPGLAQEVHQGRGDRAQDREFAYYAMVRMSTFINLVDRVGYVAVDVPGADRGHLLPGGDKNDYRLVGNADSKSGRSSAAPRWRTCAAGTVPRRAKAEMTSSVPIASTDLSSTPPQRRRRLRAATAPP